MALFHRFSWTLFDKFVFECKEFYLHYLCGMCPFSRKLQKSSHFGNFSDKHHASFILGISLLYNLFPVFNCMHFKKIYNKYFNCKYPSFDYFEKKNCTKSLQKNFAGIIKKIKLKNMDIS